MDFETEVTPVAETESEESQHVYEERCFICNHQCYSKPPSPSSTPNHSLAKWAVETRESVYEAFDIQVDPSFFQGTQGELPICPSCSFTVGRMKVVQQQLHDLQSLYDRIRAEIAFSIVDVVAASGGAKHHLMNIGSKSPTSLLNAFRECEAETLQQLIFESWHDRNLADADESSTLSTNKNKILKNVKGSSNSSSDLPPTLDSHKPLSTKDGGIKESSQIKTNFSGLTAKDDSKSDNLLKTTSTTLAATNNSSSNSTESSTPAVEVVEVVENDDDKDEVTNSKKRKLDEIADDDESNDGNKSKRSATVESVNGDNEVDEEEEEEKSALEIVEVTTVEEAEEEEGEDEDDVREVETEDDEEHPDGEMTNGNLATNVTITMSPQYCEDGYSSTEFINENSDDEMPYDEEGSNSNTLEITEWGGSSNGSNHHDNEVDEDVEELEHDDYEDIIFEDSSMDNIISTPGGMAIRRKSSCGIRDSLEITQNEEGLYVCMFCSKTFIHKYPYRDHLKTHTGEGPRCEICNKIFPKNHNLMLHMRTHTGEKPYVCEVCNKGFADKSNLKVHMRVHTGERPYKCEFCDQAFVNSSRLVVHRRLHTGEKPFPCTLCSRTFSTGSQLQAHQKMHYSGKPFSCDECGKGYSSNSSLQSHKNLYHGV